MGLEDEMYFLQIAVLFWTVNSSGSFWRRVYVRTLFAAA